jgi:hypothetical protein
VRARARVERTVQREQRESDSFLNMTFLTAFLFIFVSLFSFFVFFFFFFFLEIRLSGLFSIRVISETINLLRDADHSPRLSDMVKNAWSYTSTPQ